MKGKKADLIGLEFHSLTVLRETRERKSRAVVWECVCECGKLVRTTSYNLTSGHTKSCGCININNLVGRTFKRLTVLSATESRNIGNVRWRCRCDCGNIVIVNGGDLLRKKGSTKSCGCYRKDYRRKVMMSDAGARLIAKMHLVDKTNLKPSDLPNDLIEAQALRIKINRNIREIENE